MVPLTDFLIGVLSALVLYALLHRFLDRPTAAHPAEERPANSADRVHATGDTNAEDTHAA
jgi:hypothetical protein